MELTLPELIERLKTMDELELCDTLGLTSEELLVRCIDIVEDNKEELEKLVDWE